MDSPEGATTETPPEPGVRPEDAATRRWRMVPPAVTPLSSGSIRDGIVDHIRGRGRAGFRSDLVSMLEAHTAGTYTSFRRALAGCFLEVARAASGDRDSILIPAFCSSDYVEAIEGVGLRPLRYDVDPTTLAADMPSLKSGLRRDPLAVVTINVLGYGSPMERIARLCADQDAYLIEALGYALGTTYRDTRLGRFGDCSVLNFQQGKPIPVGGGMVVGQAECLEFQDDTRPAVAPNVLALSGYAALGRPRPYFAYRKLSDVLAALPVAMTRDTTHPEAKFDVEYSPPFATISNFQGSVGRWVLQELAAHRRHRQRTAEFYARELSDLSALRQVRPVDGLSNLQYVRFPLLVDTPALRARIRQVLNGIGIQATSLYDWPVIDPDEYPGAAQIQDAILTLPTHPYVDARDRAVIVETIKAVVRAN